MSSLSESIRAKADKVVYEFLREKGFKDLVDLTDKVNMNQISFELFEVGPDSSERRRRRLT